MSHVIDGTTQVWRALGDPTRRRLLDLLAAGPQTTGWLADQFELSRYGIMRHLGVLETAGLVTVQRRGKHRLNHLNPVPLRQAYQRWMAPHTERVADAVLALKAAAENQEGAMSEIQMSTPRISTLDVRSEVTAAAPRAHVFDTLLGMRWWPYPYRDDASIGLEPKPGGRFTATWGEDEGQLLGLVTRLQRPDLLAVSGAMGMTGSVTTTWTLTLSDRGGATLVTVSHTGFGEIDEADQARYARGWRGALDQLAQAAQA
jgi:DNA-binding transcriptional ArsR family regulator/uncharacterized protein YndB with AHSA1/START domain